VRREGRGRWGGEKGNGGQKRRGRKEVQGSHSQDEARRVCIKMVTTNGDGKGAVIVE